MLVVVRLYVAVDGMPFRVALCNDGVEVAGFDAYQSDSLLLTPIIRCAQAAATLHLSFITRLLGVAAAAESPALFTVSYAGAFVL